MKMKDNLAGMRMLIGVFLFLSLWMTGAYAGVTSFQKESDGIFTFIPFLLKYVQTAWWK